MPTLSYDVNDEGGMVGLLFLAMPGTPSVTPGSPSEALVVKALDDLIAQLQSNGIETATLDMARFF